MPNDETVSVRYMVTDVEQAIAFYTTMLGFQVLTNFAPAFADVKRGNLRLLLDRLRDAGATFRNDIVEGPGGRQILLEDPFGNVVELFQPASR